MEIDIYWPTFLVGMVALVLNGLFWCYIGQKRGRRQEAKANDLHKPSDIQEALERLHKAARQLEDVTKPGSISLRFAKGIEMLARALLNVPENEKYNEERYNTNQNKQIRDAFEHLDWLWTSLRDTETQNTAREQRLSPPQPQTPRGSRPVPSWAHQAQPPRPVTQQGGPSQAAAYPGPNSQQQTQQMYLQDELAAPSAPYSGPSSQMQRMPQQSEFTAPSAPHHGTSSQQQTQQMPQQSGLAAPSVPNHGASSQQRGWFTPPTQQQGSPQQQPSAQLGGQAPQAAPYWGLDPHQQPIDTTQLPTTTAAMLQQGRQHVSQPPQVTGAPSEQLTQQMPAMAMPGQQSPRPHGRKYMENLGLTSDATTDMTTAFPPKTKSFMIGHGARGYTKRHNPQN